MNSHVKGEWIFISNVNEFLFRRSINCHNEGQWILSFQMPMNSHFKGQWILISKVNELDEEKMKTEEALHDFLPVSVVRSMKVKSAEVWRCLKEYGSKYEGEERREGEIQHDGRIFGQTSPHLTNLRQHNLSKNNPNTGRTHPLYARIYWLDLTNLLPIITQ